MFCEISHYIFSNVQDHKERKIEKKIWRRWIIRAICRIFKHNIYIMYIFVCKNISLVQSNIKEDGTFEKISNVPHCYSSDKREQKKTRHSIIYSK